MKSRILVSACLLGEPVRYDGRSKIFADAVLSELVDDQRVIAFCPEVAGGLMTPRTPAEIQYGDGLSVLEQKSTVTTQTRVDVTQQFVDGARKALELCQRYGINTAILTELSPSCASSEVYDGTFNGVKHAGTGVTTALLRSHQITVFSQYQIADAKKHLEL